MATRKVQIKKGEVSVFEFLTDNKKMIYVVSNHDLEKTVLWLNEKKGEKVETYTTLENENEIPKDMEHKTYRFN